MERNSMEITDIIKIGSVELTRTEAEKFCQEGKYIVACRRIYALHYSTAQQRVYGSQIYYERGALPFTKRGRFVVLSAADVNKLAGMMIVNE